MTIYQVVFYNQFGDRVADFGYYEDKLDAEKRAFEVKIKTSIKSGKICIEDIFVHESSQEIHTNEREHHNKEEKCIYSYDLKSDS